MIRVRGLEYTYAGARSPALKALNFSVEDGEVFGFLGPSGAGKTTTQKVLVGLLDDYTGEATVLGREVRAWGRDLYERIGMAAETPNLYGKLTGRENLELFAALHGGAVRDPDELLALVGLAEATDQRVLAYSKGMRTRLNFVRALLHDPELVFLDEPTAGIDPGNARVVKDVIGNLRDGGTTVFLATHDMTVADQLCDRVAFIVEGQLPVIDAPLTLKLEYGTPAVEVAFRAGGSLEGRQFPLAGLGDDEAFQDLLRTGRVETLHTAEATLEDVFIEVTGRALT